MTISQDEAAVEMTLLWKSQNDSHRSLEISHRTRDSHIPTSRFLLVIEKKTKEIRMNRPQSGSLSERRTGLLSERRAHAGPNMSALQDSLHGTDYRVALLSQEDTALHHTRSPRCSGSLLRGSLAITTTGLPPVSHQDLSRRTIRLLDRGLLKRVLHGRTIPVGFPTGLLDSSMTRRHRHRSPVL